MTITEKQARTILDVIEVGNSESRIEIDAYVLAIDVLEMFPALRTEFFNLRRDAVKYVGIQVSDFVKKLLNNDPITPEQLGAMLGKSPKWVEFYKNG